jgi:hypothetical protein
MRLFKNIKYDAIVACASIGAMVYYSMTVIWPTLVGALFTTDVKEIGWLSCAVGGGLLFGQISAGMGIRFLPRMKIQMTVAAVIMVAFVASLASVNEYSRTRTVVSLLIAAGKLIHIPSARSNYLKASGSPPGASLVGKED